MPKILRRQVRHVRSAYRRSINVLTDGMGWITQESYSTVLSCPKRFLCS
jgi:hypothetical protein